MKRFFILALLLSVTLIGATNKPTLENLGSGD